MPCRSDSAYPKENLIEDLVPPLVATVVALIFGFLVRSVGVLTDVKGHPDRLTRPHIRSTPSAGGLAILVGAISGFAVAKIDLPIVIVIAVVGCFLVGLLSDMRGLSTSVELILQTLCGLVLVAGSIIFTETAGFLVFGIPGGKVVTWVVTLIVFVGIVNAVGLSDGIDGVAAGLVALSGFGLAILSARFGGPELFALIFAGAALGFLGVNAPPAAVHLGNNGAMLLGAALGVSVITIGTTIPFLLAGLTCLGVMAVELLLSLIRRIVGDHTPETDRLSDQLIARGMSGRSVLVTTYLLQVMFVAIGAVMGQLFDGQALVIFGAIWVMVLVMLFAGGFVSYRVDA